MAIMAHCVVCGYHSDSEIAGWVRFADYDPAWNPPTALGWSNELGLTESPGVGCFCRDHLEPARELSGLPAAEAVRRLKAMPRPCAVGGCLRDADDWFSFSVLWNVPWDAQSFPRSDAETSAPETSHPVTWFCDEHLQRAYKLDELPTAEALRQLSTGADLDGGKAMLPPCGVDGCHSHAVGSVEFTEPWSSVPLSTFWRIKWWFCRKHHKRGKKLHELPAAEALRQLSTGADRQLGPRAWLRKLVK